MRKRLPVAVLVVIALCVATAPVVQAANVTNVNAPDVRMDPGTVTTDLEVYNDGNASTADVSIDDAPSGVSVSHPGAETLRSDGTTGRDGGPSIRRAAEMSSPRRRPSWGPSSTCSGMRS